MKLYLIKLALVCSLQAALSAEIRLLDLEPNDAQQYIDKQDTTLKYAPKIETNVPAVRFLGNEPHHVLEDIYLANQYHGQDGLGGYLYGYAVPDIAKTERKKAGGDLTGAYNYISGDGQEIKVQYWDDGTGFHQIDNVPKILPKQIDDLPEVKAAKEEHLRLWHEQAERNSKPVASPYNSEGQYAEGPLSVQGQKNYPYVQPGQYQPQPQPSQYHAQSQPQPYQAKLQPLPLQYQAQPQPQQYQAQAQPQQYQAKPQLQPQQYQAQPQPQSYQAKPQPQPYQQPQAHSTNLVNQYQQQKQQFPNPGQSVQYQGDQAGQYQGQQTQTVSQYQAQPGTEAEDSSGQYTETDEGQYKAEEGEEQGPPRGFFYNFDYPVGIIVQKEGAVQKREGDVKDVYAQNKAEYEKQLQAGHSDSRSARSSSGYLYVKN